MKQKKPFSVLSILIVILFSAGVMLGSIDQEETGASLIVVAAAVFITVLLLQAGRQLCLYPDSLFSASY